MTRVAPTDTTKDELIALLAQQVAFYRQKSEFFEKEAQRAAAKARAGQARLRQALVCPLTGEPAADPVVIGTGRVFERRAIEARFAQQWSPQCPVTKQPVDGSLYTPPLLAAAVEAARGI